MPGRSRTDHAPPHIGEWYLATFFGTVFCISLYTVYGFFFVLDHASRIAHKTELLQRLGMIPLIGPHDIYLTGFIHLLTSSLLFGSTLGNLFAFLCMALSFPQWLTGSLRNRDMLLLLVVAPAAMYFGFSYERPLLSIICGVLCPFAFVIPWLFVLRRSKGAPIKTGHWAVLTGILVTPLVIIVLMRPSYILIRDTMLEIPVIRVFSDIYYNHMVLSAEVIKTPSMRAQNVMVLSQSIRNTGPVPHGTLLIRAQDPCSIREADMVFAREPLPCRAVILNNGLPTNHNGLIFGEYDRLWDLNRHMREGIGILYFKGFVQFGFILLVSWIGIGLVRLCEVSRVSVILLLGIYLGLFIPVWHTVYLNLELRKHPEKNREFLDSGQEKKVYLASLASPAMLTLDDLRNLMSKGSTRVRINALAEAGERRDTSLIPVIEQSLRDPQINIRNKACRALERIASPQTIPELERTARTDPSWYVRNAAYYALATVKPDARVVEQ